MNPRTLSDISDAVVDTIQVTTSTHTLSYRFLNNRSPRSPRPIYHKLDAERKRTEKWANEVRSINIKKLRETFSPEECNRVLDALGELRHNYEKASLKLESVDQRERNLPDLDLLTKDYDDLEKLLSNLTSANDALQQIVHAPSMYSPKSNVKSAQRRGELAPERKVMDMTLMQETSRPPFIPAVRTIYRTTYSTLVTISVRRADPKIARSASRLKLWGAGLFEMAIPLDTVFDSNRDAFRPVRQGILRILVDILVWAEQELNKMNNNGSNTEPLGDAQSAVTALLGTDELIPMALESWKDSVDQHEYVQAGHVPNYNPVPGLVEILFDLLPALRATRRTYCFREAEGPEDNGTNTLLHQPAALPGVGKTLGHDLAPRRSPITTQTLSSEQPIFNEKYIDLANQKFDQVNDILKRLDKNAKKNDKPPYTSKFRIERESLDRLYVDRRSRTTLSIQDLGEISEKQKQLVERLDEFVADSSGLLNPSLPLGFIRKRQGKSLSDHTLRAQSFLTYLTHTNKVLRNIMYGRGQNVEGS